MTRVEADNLVCEYDDARHNYNVLRKMGHPGTADVAFAVMNAQRERLIDALCGEPATEPLAGNAP